MGSFFSSIFFGTLIREPIFPARNSPIAVPKNHIPIINATIFSGASFVTMDKPMGEIQSSPNIIKQYPQRNGHSGTNPVFTLATQLK